MSLTFAEIFEKACKAAQESSDYAEATTDHWYPCGFAWINIKPARGPFISWCRKNAIGGKAYEGGWNITSYAVCRQTATWSQSMVVKSAGVDAAVRVLRENGINAYPCNRMD